MENEDRKIEISIEEITEVAAKVVEERVNEACARYLEHFADCLEKARVTGSSQLVEDIAQETVQKIAEAARSFAHVIRT